MASPLDLLGLDQGLGPAMTGIQNTERHDLSQQSGLADLYLKQQQAQQGALAQQKAALELDEARQLSPSKVQAGIAGNQSKVGESQLAMQQQFGQMITQAGSMLERVPPEQRGQYFQRMAQQIPGIEKDPSFQMLSMTDPNELPLALKTFGTQMLLETGDQLRKQQLQKQGEDARMAQARMEQNAATGRTAMGENAAMRRQEAAFQNARDLEQMRIDAGKYQKRNASVSTLMDIAGKAGYEKAATAARIMSNDNNASEEERILYRQMAEEFGQANERQKAAGGYAKPILDPNSPTGLGTTSPYGMQGGPVFGGGSINQPPGQKQALPVPQGLPKGTVNNGDGTFTLPDGRRGRFK